MTTSLVDIVEIYAEPISSSQIDERMGVHYNLRSADQEQLTGWVKTIDEVVRAKRHELRVEHIRPLHLSSSQAEELRMAIKSDQQWKETCGQMIHYFAPDLSEEDQQTVTTSITLPWWNALQLFRQGKRFETEYDNGRLRLNLDLSHSYITQLMRSGKIAKRDHDSASISNILLTSDKLLILGYRGGHNLPHTLMTIPAGSLQYEGGRDPLFGTLQTEMEEEVGAVPLDDLQMIGRIFDYTIGKNSLYVSRSVTLVPFSEVLNRWNGAEDKREHEYLIAIEDDPEKVLAVLKRKQYDPTKANTEKPGQTTIENAGRILPPAIGSLLLHYAQQEGPDWARYAERELNGTYQFQQ